MANELGVLLPSSPNAQQMAWMADISSRTGADYDRTFVQKVRRGARHHPAGHRGRAQRHPQRQGAGLRRGRGHVRDPAPPVPGEHRPGELRGPADAAVARPAVRLDRSAGPDPADRRVRADRARRDRAVLRAAGPRQHPAGPGHRAAAGGRRPPRHRYPRSPRSPHCPVHAGLPRHRGQPAADAGAGTAHSARRGRPRPSTAPRSPRVPLQRHRDLPTGAPGRPRPSGRSPNRTSSVRCPTPAATEPSPTPAATEPSPTPGRTDPAVDRDHVTPSGADQRVLPASVAVAASRPAGRLVPLPHTPNGASCSVQNDAGGQCTSWPSPRRPWPSASVPTACDYSLASPPGAPTAPGGGSSGDGSATDLGRGRAGRQHHHQPPSTAAWRPHPDSNRGRRDREHDRPPSTTTPPPVTCRRRPPTSPPGGTTFRPRAPTTTAPPDPTTVGGTRPPSAGPTCSAGPAGEGSNRRLPAHTGFQSNTAVRHHPDGRGGREDRLPSLLITAAPTAVDVGEVVRAPGEHPQPGP